MEKIKILYNATVLVDGKVVSKVFKLIAELDDTSKGSLELHLKSRGIDYDKVVGFIDAEGDFIDYQNVESEDKYLSKEPISQAFDDKEEYKVVPLNASAGMPTE